MTSARAGWRGDVSLFVVSAAILTLEVLQTKIFNFSLDPLTIYLAVAVCMLGLSTAATVLAIAPPIASEQGARLGAAGAIVGAVVVLVAHLLFARWSPDVRTGGPGVLVTLVALVLPYVGFGLATTVLMMGCGEGIGRAYAVNLAGSGAGCLLVFPLLDHLGAERTLAVVGLLGIAGGALLVPSDRRIRGLAVASTLVLAATFVAGPRLFVFRPDPTGQLAVIQGEIAKLVAAHGPGTATATPVFTRWDRTGRIDVYRLTTSRAELVSRVGGPLDTMFFAQDASAGSFLLGVGDDVGRAAEFFDRTVYGAGYVTGPKRDVLVIGLGGAPDILSALYHRADRIVGVEINRTVVDMMHGELGDFVGRPYDRPEVLIELLDGRTYLRQASETFDLIQLSGVDTKSVFFASGGLALNQSYLYTRQSLGEMLRRLRPDGLLTINRFGQFDVQRLTSLAVAALRDAGVVDPDRHLIAVAQGFWRAVLVKRSPFTDAEVRAVAAWVERTATAPPIVIPAYDWIGVSFQYPLKLVYSPPPLPVADGPFFQALVAGRLDDFIANEPLDFSPPDDDRPFYFFPIRPAQILRMSAPGLDSVLHLAGWLGLVSLAMIVVPLAAWRRRGLRAPRAGRAVVYFACLGVGFMFVEIGLIHRFVLLLGHQTYSITVVLFGMLLGAGVGSLSAGRLTAYRRRRLGLVLAALVAGIVVAAFGLGHVFDAVATASFLIRLGVAIVLLTSLGFLMGVPFPAALAALGTREPGLVAWAIGINGLASVLGGTLAVPAAMVMGFRALLLVAACLYAVALVSAPMTAGGVSAAE